MSRFYAVIVALIVVFVVLSASTFQVGVAQRAIKLELGDVVASDYEPGLHFKIPFYQRVYKFDKRVLTMDASPDRVLTTEKKNLIVDAFAKWKIVNTVDFFKSTGGKVERARTRLHQYVKKQLYDEFGQRTIHQVVSTQRGEVMEKVEEAVDKKAKDLGIKLVDVRVKKVDLPDSVLKSVYSRMEQERKAAAQRFRAEGHEKAQRIRAKANRQVKEIGAKAYRKAQGIRGEGDAKATRIYANAYQEDPDFYSFYRSLKAYRKSFKGDRDALVLQPDSEFFDYFDNAKGRDAGDGDSPSNE